jgi:hypothetical protein
MHGSSPGHLVVLDIITELIFGEEHKCVAPDVAFFLFMAFQILSLLRIYQGFKLHQVFKDLARNVTTFVKVLQVI